MLENLVKVKFLHIDGMIIIKVLISEMSLDECIRKKIRFQFKFFFLFELHACTKFAQKGIDVC